MAAANPQKLFCGELYGLVAGHNPPRLHIDGHGLRHPHGRHEHQPLVRREGPNHVIELPRRLIDRRIGQRQVFFGVLLVILEIWEHWGDWQNDGERMQIRSRQDSVPRQTGEQE